jgi:hypothetical protein
MPINLSYPLGVEGDPQQGHYIMFMINENTQGTVSRGAPAAIRRGRGHKSAPVGFQDKKFINEHLNIGSGENTETFMSAPPAGGLHMDRPGTTRMAKAITLYMPPSVKVSYKSNYKNQEIGALASMGSQMTQSITDEVAKLSRGGPAGFGDSIVAGFKDTAESAGMLGLEALTATRAAATPGSVALAQLSFGAVLGSKMEVMFTDVERRAFSFQFNFIPKSEDESRMVYKIVQTFKEHMLPEYISNFNLPFDLGKFKLTQGKIQKIPNTFDIFYFYHSNENPFLNRISTCYLTSLDVDYGDDKYVTYEPTTLEGGGLEGPPPQKTAISLSFTEIETITRERAKQGF